MKNITTKNTKVCLTSFPRSAWERYTALVKTDKPVLLLGLRVRVAFPRGAWEREGGLD